MLTSIYILRPAGLHIGMKKILSVIMTLVTGGVSVSLLGLGIHGAEAARGVVRGIALN